MSKHLQKARLTEEAAQWDHSKYLNNNLRKSLQKLGLKEHTFMQLLTPLLKSILMHRKWRILRRGKKLKWFGFIFSELADFETSLIQFEA